MEQAQTPQPKNQSSNSSSYKTINDIWDDIDRYGAVAVALKLAGKAGFHIRETPQPFATSVSGFGDKEINITLIYENGLVVNVEARDEDGKIEVSVVFDHLARGSCECY